ncbi:CMP-N-acetylneuraminate-poly-alpha-2,8-sialyltransferase-like [Branchiostoma floridae]|uniref:CMP-N-acetylneuraminate-poly-alpha-2, 8-sialyltransferase-like n=1 Tax=Branchiostoma floridae TaxID=7739 RepID=A0A9J7LE13_BRAFL|nr:CMP-N-acetylneuraminate-poly-alpha-2,8-sialyltransferase-like [Branchiostoma floridae]
MFATLLTAFYMLIWQVPRYFNITYVETRVVPTRPAYRYLNQPAQSSRPGHPPQQAQLPQPAQPSQPPAPPAQPIRPPQRSQAAQPPRPAQPSRPTLVFGNLAPESAWHFRPDALTDVRNITAKLNLNSNLRKWKLGNFTEDVDIGHYNTCAVVGNSGVLLGSQCGAEIDSMDYVIRIDLPAIKGYEKDVGKRTSMVLFNLKGPDRIRQSALFKNRSQDVYESRFRSAEGAVLFADKRSRKNIETAVKAYKLSFPLLSRPGKLRTGISRTASEIANKKMKGTPSVGLVSVLMMTTFCDHPYMYGFYPFTEDANNNSILYHYYPGDFVDPPLHHAFAPKHKMNQEYDFNRELHKRGVLKMQVGPCGKQ